MTKGQIARKRIEAKAKAFEARVQALAKEEWIIEIAKDIGSEPVFVAQGFVE